MIRWGLPPAYDKGLSSSFEKTGSNENVIKTYRGTQGGDAFNGVAEGHSGRDAGYLSTSHNLGAAENFGRGGTVSTIFGRSGLDVSEISIEGDEKEVLYNKNTDMTVLFSERGRDGITRRVLEESSLSVEAGTKKGLVDALDLPSSFKK
ncbi:ADP-ribosyltransferase [Vibrio pectenicida]|uniref:ADP-ribosyltransferase n=1 Tax=Vibrio pectenicida TaxID=62763 RepID=UPI003B99FB95